MATKYYRQTVLLLTFCLGLILAGCATTSPPTQPKIVAEALPETKTKMEWEEPGEWQPVTGEDLRNFMSGTTLEWEEPGTGKNRGEYRADGTGTLHTFGASIPRTWEIKGDDQISVKVGKITQSWRLERNISDPTLYRSIDVTSGTKTEIRMSNDDATGTIQANPEIAGNNGGAAAASASEIAAQLANPSSPLAALNFNLQFRSFKGDLPGADDESSTSLLF